MFGLALYGVSKLAFNIAKPISNEARESQTVGTPDASPDNLRHFMEKLDELNIPDEHLVACIKKSAGYLGSEIRSGRITSPTEMTQLDCDKDGITQLNGLENFTRLKKLNLYGNPVSFLDPIQQLHSLEELNLAQTKVTTLWSISGLQGVKKLSISGLKLNDLGNLFDFKQLKKLDYVISPDYSCSELDTFFSELRSKSSPFYVQRPSQCTDQFGEKVRF